VNDKKKKEMEEKLFNSEGININPMEKVVIMAKMFEVMSLIAGLSNKLHHVDLISDKEADAIREMTTDAHAFIGSVLEVEPSLLHLAAEFSSIPDDVCKEAREMTDNSMSSEEAHA